MGNKIDDKTFSFLGDFSETVLRAIFIALIGVAIIALIACALIAKSQNSVEDDPQKRKMNNRKMWTALVVLLFLIVLWPLVELIKGNVRKPSNGGKSSSVILYQLKDIFSLKQMNLYAIKGIL
ncbi:Mbov_0395 family pilin-like conjugal transfer protein [Metamycoplasma buccale]|uniref:Mbov_0395 family pilin-like conjugal transfer protein n=1 Tax=Metamycoplasma buccale TaxID=55602 RepID=UPI00398E5644